VHRVQLLFDAEIGGDLLLVPADGIVILDGNHDIGRTIAVDIAHDKIAHAAHGLVKDL